MQNRVLTPEEIATRSEPEVPFLRLPERGSLFADRAARLRALAPGHSMGGYLEFIALVADGQQRLLENMPPVRLPSPGDVGRCNERRVPPLNFQTHLRDPQWCNGLRHLLRDLTDRTTGKSAAVVSALEGSRDE